MSRARLFKRAANWLKNCIQTKKQIKEVKERRDAFKFAFGQLEERVVLDADFTFDGLGLTLENYTSLGSEALNVSDTGTHFEFALAEGVWSGVDSPFAFGDGTDTLSLDKFAFPTSITSDGAGIDVNFDTVDFDSALLVDVSFTGGSISQTGAITADVANMEFIGDDIFLTNTGNDFGSVSFDGSTVFVDDSDDIAAEILSTGAARVDAAGEIAIANSVVDGVFRLNSLANGGAGADIDIDSTDAFNLILNAGTGDIDARDATNDIHFASVTTANGADFASITGLNIRDVTANSFSVQSNSILVVGDVNSSTVHFDSDSVVTDSTGSLTTSELTVLSGGDVLLDSTTNAIDKIAGVVDGNFELMNTVNLDIDELTFNFVDGSSSTTTGLNVIGDVAIEMIDLDLVSVEPIVVGGALDLTLGTGTANLLNTNDFGAVNIVSGSQVDLIDVNSVTLTGANLSDRLAVGSVGDVNLDGNITATNAILFDVFGNLNQNSGMVSSAGLLLEVDADASLGELNQIGSAGTPGLLSATVGGDLLLNNLFGIEIADQSYTLLNATNFAVTGLDVTGTACFHSDGFTTSSAVFSATNLLIDSSAGATLPTFTVDDLILQGTGTFDVTGANDIGRLAADIDGDLLLNNTVDTEIADLTLCSIQVVGVNLTGNLDVTLSDDNLTQSADVTVGGHSTFAVGAAGNIDLSSATNNFDSIEILSSDDVMFGDVNHLAINGSVGNTANFVSYGGEILLNGDVTTSVETHFGAAFGLMQNAGIVDTPSLNLSGTGDFNLLNLNAIGNGAPGNLGLAITDGSVSLNNDYAVHFNSASMVGAGTYSGDVNITTSNDDITQDAAAPVQFAGTTTFDVGTGDICLEFGDGNADTFNDNDLNILNILSASIAEVVDTNDLTVNDATLTNRLILETEFGDMSLTGNIVSPNGLLLLSGGSINQTGGTVDTPEVLMNAGGDAILGEVNSIGNGAAGVIAGTAGGEFFVNSQFGINIDSVTINRKDGTPVTYTGIDAAKVKVEALSVLVTAATTATDLISIDSDNGVSQNAAGILTAAGIILTGEGDFFLTQANLIGSAIDPGKIAVAVLGTIDINNEFGLLAATLVCGTSTFVGINVGTDSGTYSGDLTVDTTSSNGDFSQEMAANVVVEGDTRIDVGTGNICLNKGDTDADTVTNNDFQSLFIESATVAEIADINDVIAADITVSDAFSLSAEGAIQINDDLVVPKIHLQAGAGVSQQVSTFIATLELILQGSGDFNLIENNRIGDLFTEGKLAAEIDGILSLSNDFDLLIDDLTYTFKDASTVNVSGVTVEAGGLTGNLTINTSNDDVSQTAAGQVVVAGLTSLNVGVACVGLAVSATNDFADVQIVQADEVELWDGVDGFTLLDVTVDDQSFFKSTGLLTLSGDIQPGSRLLIDSAGGAFQTISSTITTQELLVQGTGDFSFEQANDIQNLAGLGLIAVDVDGNFALQNGVATQVSSLSFTKKDGSTVDLFGVDITGDFGIELPDADFDQDPNSAFIAGGVSTFALGIGCLDLSFGDENFDSANENNFGTISVVSASVVDVLDVDGFLIGESVISDRARFESETGTIVIDRDLRVTNQILFVSNLGMMQNLGTNIETPEVLFMGAGDFVLDQLNSLGNSGTPAQVAAMIDGSLEIKNDFGVNIASLTYINKDASTVDLVGIQMDNTTGSGDITFDLSDANVTQNDDAPIIVTGLTTFDVGTLGTVDLSFADTIPDLDLINENDFNTVAVDNGDTVEINDINAVTVVGAFTNNLLSITSDTDEIVLDGNVIVTNTVKFDAQMGLSQDSGIVDSSSMILFGQGYFDFNLPNALGNGVPGLFAADVDGDINLVNSNAVQINSLGYTDLNGNAFVATGVGNGAATLDNFRLKADGIQLHQAITSNTLIFETTAGVSQFDTQTTDGLINTQDFSLSGNGFVNLPEANSIGSGIASGHMAIDFAGNVIINTLFGIDFDTVSFTEKDGSVRNDVDVNVVGQGGAAGNFQLSTGDDITDAANVDINVAGFGTFIADNGNADLILGDAFSSTGGPNNITNFGSVGFKAFNGTVHEDSDMVLDGIMLGGNLNVSAFGNLSQSGDDPFSAIGTSAIEVEGAANFIVDADQIPADHFNDNFGRDVMLQARDNDELIDNLFAGPVTIAGSLNAGGLNGSGTLRNVQFRNASFEVASVPTFDAAGDPLRSLSVWLPNSSAHINQDLEVLQNFTLFAGVDSVNGKLGGSLDVTNALLNRKITDADGVQINVSNNVIFEAGNSIILADNAGDTLIAGNKLQASTHGGDAGSRIRVGISNTANRGTDSGATVLADTLRFRAKPTTLANSEHASFNIDKDVEIVGPNVARSLMLVVDGHITDDVDADINVKNSTTLVAEGNKDIILGESFSTNFINNNVHNFGTLALKGRNADITEDSAILLDGINLTGDLSITAMGHIRQAGKDRFNQIGTRFIEVAGDATFKVDQAQLPADQLNDTIGQDVKIMSTPQQELMDNVIDGEVIITTTDVDDSNNRKGSIRNVEIRNTSVNAKDPIFNLLGSDKIRNLQIWTTNASLDFRNSISVLNNFTAFAGVDSVNGLRNGRLQIVNNNAVRDITDSVGVTLSAGRSMNFRVSNHIHLADTAGDSIRVDMRATFITLGGAQGNQIDVGTDVNAARGTDSGANVDIDTLKFRAPVNGNFGLVTIVADSPMAVTPDSAAKSSVILP